MGLLGGGQVMAHRRRFFVPCLEVLEDRRTPSILMVTNLNDSGAGSLRAEVGLANPSDVIAFTSGLQGVIPWPAR